MKMSKLQTLTALSVSADLRAEIMIDLLLVIGLSLMGYGLWLFKPWVAFTVIGAVIILIAVVAALLKNRGGQKVNHAG